MIKIIKILVVFWPIIYIIKFYKKESQLPIQKPEKGFELIKFQKSFDFQIVFPIPYF
jgi:hypothetical protein